MAPLGLPVVPDVYEKVKISSGFIYLNSLTFFVPSSITYYIV